MEIKMMKAWVGSREGWSGRAIRIAVALISLASLGSLACGKEPDRPARDTGAAVAVTLETAAESDWTDGIPVTATLTPFRRATPGTVLMGRVEEVLRREGDPVKAGAVLARVESRDVAARLAQAEAAVAAAKAQAENARLTKERMERLEARNAASRKNVEDAATGYEAAAAGLRAAEEGVNAARVAYGYTQVTAPFAGTVTEKRIEAGDTASPGMPLFVVEDTSKMKVEAQVAESSLPGLARGQKVEVAVDGAGSGGRAGVVEEILPAGDPRSRTFTLRVVLENRDGALRTGMFARMVIEKGTRKALAVPEAALVRKGPLTGLFVADSGTGAKTGSEEPAAGREGVARLRWVAVGESRNGKVEILTGLSAGERYVLAPAAGLEDGGRIEVK
jgi:RND family efflux transporter MFP subunit